MFRNAEALDQAIDYKRDLGYEPRKKKCFGMASLYVEQCMHIRVYIVEHICICIHTLYVERDSLNNLSVCYLSAYLSVSLSIRPSVCLSVCLSVCRSSIYLSLSLS